MNAKAEPSYLDVRYSAAVRPYTSYPAQLCAHLKTRYLAHHGGRLLDLGCGRGEFLDAFSSLGWTGSGVDRELAREYRYSASVSVCDFGRAPLPFDSETFDVVFHKSVLEHLQDPTPALQECFRVLRPGGRMVAMVPDFRAQWRHFYDDWTHVRPFTLEGLTQCLVGHGFELRDARRFRQLPLLWERPALGWLADAAELLPDGLKRQSKFVRFAKEWMLLVVVDRPLRSVRLDGPGR